MRDLNPAISGVIPALLTLLFATWLGTWWGVASGNAAVTAHWIAAAAAALAGKRWLNPLDLGRRGVVFVPALILTTAVATALSPVPRAGRMSATMVPIFVLLTATFSRVWRDERGRRLGVLALSLVVSLVSGWALIGWLFLETPTASLPLGHHNLLAPWLIMTAPIALVSWRYGLAGKISSSLAGSLALVALVATGSFAALATLGIAIVILASTRAGRTYRLWLVGLVCVLVLIASPRALSVIEGLDTSTLARIEYVRAGWEGFRERPVLGWGPGSTPWTISEHFRPRPGVHPPDLLLADLHSLPVTLAYELGAIGVLVILGLSSAFVLARCRGTVVDRGLATASSFALAAGALVSCAGLPLSVPALPMAFAVGVGALMVSTSDRERDRQQFRLAEHRGGPVLVAAVLVLSTIPLDRAHVKYDQALRAESGEQVGLLEEAVALDPGFPLYWSVLASMAAGEDEALSRQAAERARGVAALWLSAGIAANDRAALVLACDLNPLSAIAPFLLATEDQTPDLADRRAARAILADPRLLGGLRWGPRQRRAHQLLLDIDELEPGWRKALSSVAPTINLDSPDRRQLLLTADSEPSRSFSLFLFRRRPWRRELVRIDLDAAVTTWNLPAPATSVASTPVELFVDGCDLGLKE